MESRVDASWRRALLPLIPDRESQIAVFSAAGEALWTRSELRAKAQAWVERLATPRPQLIFLACRNEPPVLAALLGALAARHAIALLDAEAPFETLARLVLEFRPYFVISSSKLDLGRGFRSISDDGGLFVAVGGADESPPINPDLAILLSTSGTTGSSKFVRLSSQNVRKNAAQISAALGITGTDVAAAHLPLHYSYGLSVITSHLQEGAGVHLLDGSITTPEFWDAIRRSGATHFPGVPFHYDFLARADLGKMLPPSLRTFTQAGGALAPRMQRRMHEKLSEIGGSLFVMYGQTEAAPRMTTLPADRLSDKLGSVGKALVDGRLAVIDENGRPLPAGEVGRIVYEGPNVMMGYAVKRSDLALGDEMSGRLDTGDLGRLDDDGYLTITGRANRFAKLYGLRIGLDEVEARFGGAGEVAAVDGGDRILLFTTSPDLVAALVSTVAAEYKIMSANFVVRQIDEIPRKANGKVDYQRLDVAG
jgi:acyl-CoA synthetase (AMP-forming)/AMP-acid ligase II